MKNKKFLYIIISLFPAFYSCLTDMNKINYNDLMRQYNGIQGVSVIKEYYGISYSFDDEENKLFDVYEKLVKIPVFIERYKELKIIYITILDNNGNPCAAMTAKALSGIIKVIKGYDTTGEPAMVLELTAEDILNIYDYFSDNKITAKEEFYLSNLFLIPSYESLFRNKDFIFFTKTGLIKFQTPVFLILNNKNNYPLRSNRDNTKITIYEENGQYKVRKGLHGNAGQSIDIDPAKTLKYYKIVLKILNETDLEKKIRLLKNAPYEFAQIYLF